MRTRFVIEVDGKTKTVFNVLENNNNYDLNIHITGGGRTYTASTLYDLIAISDVNVFKACKKHISIHSSPASQEYNVIKRTVAFKDGTEGYSQTQVTSGIKKDNLFVPVLFRVCGDLSKTRYSLPEPCVDSLVSLGQYDPNKDQLRFMVICGRNEKLFPKHAEHPSNLLCVEFKKFALTVIWSYLNKPSHPHAIDFFLTTKIETGPIRGFEWFEIYNLYSDLYMVHANNYFAIYGEGRCCFQTP